MSQIETNVLVMGKSGAGKSSFINYIYGEYTRKTGTGKPVTEKGLYKVVQSHDGIVVNLYDTWGLEANKSEEWRNIILNEVKGHNKKFSIKEWFHTIFYCFSVSSARVEDFEIRKIINPLLKERNNIVIILTHGDVPDAQRKSQGMIDRLLKETKIKRENIILVANEAKKLLGGGVKAQFGKEEVISRMKENLWLDIKSKLPRAYENYLFNEIKEWKNESYDIVDKRVKFLNRNKVEKQIVSEVNYNLKIRLKKMDEETKRYTNEAYEYYVNLLGYLFRSQSSIRIDVDKVHTNSQVRLEMDFREKLKGGLTITLVGLVPLVNLAVSAKLKEKSKDTLKDEIQKAHNRLTSNIPDYVAEFRAVIKGQYNQIFLLDSAN